MVCNLYEYVEKLSETECTVSACTRKLAKITNIYLDQTKIKSHWDKSNDESSLVLWLNVRWTGADWSQLQQNGQVNVHFDLLWTKTWKLKYLMLDFKKLSPTTLFTIDRTYITTIMAWLLLFFLQSRNAKQNQFIMPGPIFPYHLLSMRLKPTECCSSIFCRISYMNQTQAASLATECYIH